MFNYNIPFKDLRRKAQSLYNSTKEIKCPALKGKVVFSSDGFHHLRYNPNRSERSKVVQRNKFAYLPEAVDVLKQSSTIQEYRNFNEPVGLKDASGYRKVCVVSYYAFWAVVNKQFRVRVVVRQIEKGLYSFWSLTPDWSLKLIGEKKQKIMGSKNLPNE